MKNTMLFNEFLNSLKITNESLSFYVDFEKCSANLQEISIKLHTLNFLLGKTDLKQAIETLFMSDKKCFEILNLLIAVRDEKRSVIDKNGNLTVLKNYFESSDKIYEFFIETGLAEIFTSKKITNLNDYVFGVEVGLDTNARKSRSGRNMEKRIASNFDENGISYREQVEHTEFSDLNLGNDLKRFDFVINTSKIVYLIECNFYSSGGLKLNETARSYTELESKISSNSKYKFIWITDGQGWFDAKNKLEEAYKSVEIYNLSNLQDFINKVKNG